MKVLVMPSNANGWQVHCLARETGKVGHLYSPGGERGPWPWLPYALDNGAYGCWDPDTNTFNDQKWSVVEGAWRTLVKRFAAEEQKPLWASVPDVPGNSARTLERYSRYAVEVIEAGLAPAFVAQDGMEPRGLTALRPFPAVVFIGGSTEWKWANWEKFADAFPHVHVGRVNSPQRLYELERHPNVKSCDGTGWFRGDPVQTSGLEVFLRREPCTPRFDLIHPFLRASPSRKRRTYAPDSEL